jgi:eukaryotic-like serine/threonine-protein kinase
MRGSSAMVLQPGSTLGPYDVLSLIGAGGMGEVYRATDTRLRREVAIKISTEAFSERFEREALAVAALNHPNICTVHDVGANYLVMELIEGPTLAEHLRQGPVPLDEALRIATQMAAALEAAHDRGIVHRDLKPANVKIKPDGCVKVLDFGLAKMGATLAAAPEQSPTFTVGATEEGMILGTAAYMSPEQARGKPVDKRTDIWAFGCVLYEMLTGKRAFAGTTLADVLAAVVTNEPDWTALPRGTPRLVASLLRRCLQKDPVRRLHDIADARLELQEAMFEPEPPDHHTSVRSHRSRVTHAIPWIVAMLCAMALVLTQVWSNRTAAPDRPVTRLELTLPAGVEPYVGPSAVAFSPDGTRFAFVGIDAGTRQLYLRRLDEFDTVPVRGTVGATAIFFSPDGRSVAVIQTDQTMKKVSLDDGLVATLAHEVDYTTGGAWGADDRITFGRRGALWQMHMSGGVATQLTTLDAENGELLHTFPAAVAGGKGLLFATVTGAGRGAAQIETLSLATGIPRRQKVVDAGTSPAYVASGHLIFFREGTLLAAPFDEDRLRVMGPGVKLIDQIGVTTAGAPMLAVSRSGSMAYMSGTAESRLVWVSRDGLEQPLTDTGRQYVFPRLAPDGKHIVVSAGGDLWVQDTVRPTLARLTTEATTGNSYGVWTPDGRVVLRTNRGLYLMEADGSGRSQRIPETTTADYPNSVSPDGETLIFLRTTADKAGDLYMLSLNGEPRPRPLVSTKAHEGGGQFSPDGKWIAYASDEFGQFQVFLRQFPGPDRKWLVSQAGKYVVWNRNGNELFYRDGNKMMAVNVSIRNGEPVFSMPRLLFEQSYEFGTGQTTTNYDVSADGTRFVMVKSAAGSRRLNVVLNGVDDPKRLAPPAR